MAESNHRTQTLAGIFVLCGLVLLGGLILEFGPLQHWLRKPYQLYAVFPDAQSIIKGSPVRFAGSPIGKVSTSPELIAGLKGVKITLEIYEEYKIPEGSLLKITPIGMMGDCAVDVIPPAPEQLTGKSVPPGSTLEGSGGADLTTKAAKITDEATEVMKDIRNGLAELNKTISRINSGVLSDENIKHVSDTLAKANESLGRIDSEVLSPENTAALHDSFALLKTTLENASKASVKADSALAKMDDAMNQLGPGLKGFAGTTATMKRAADALEGLLREARSGRGVLYALLNNTELRDNLERLVANMRQRGLLFYKDKAPPPAPVPRRLQQRSPAANADMAIDIVVDFPGQNLHARA